VVSGGIAAASVRRLNRSIVGENVDGPEDAARAEYEAKYTADRSYEILMEIYRKVLGTRG
jgi:hypothetical protein